MKTGVLAEILEWSLQRPLWQQDALRRLFTVGDLAATDTQELAALCKFAHGLSEAMEAAPLKASDLPISDAQGAAVTLVSITHHQGVNALAEEQTITFGPQLTVVYGQNAAGKSGYTRILKKACRSRLTEDILGNVVAGSAPPDARATIRYTEGTEKASFNWTAKAEPSANLADVSVFDAHCAPVYLRDATDVAFRPFGLDIFDKLSAVCDSVRALIELDRAKISPPTSGLPSPAAGTAARKLLDGLTSLTKPETVTQLATLSDAELARYAELLARQEDRKAADPAKRILDLRRRADRIEALAGHLENVNSIVSTEALDNLRKASERLSAAREALDLLRSSAFTAEQLPGTGDDAWRRMWQAAGTFAVVAFPGHQFPSHRAGARCPLCQQTLDERAEDRLKHFAEFIGSNAAIEVTAAGAAFTTAQSRIAGALIDNETVAAGLEVLAEEHDDLRANVDGYVSDAEATRAAVAGVSPPDYPKGLDDASALPATLRGVAFTLRNRATTLANEQTAPPIAEIAELQELEARRTLASGTKAVLDEIERKQKLAAFAQCLNDTNTQTITRKSTEVTQRLVTEQLRSSFQAELTALEFTHTSLEVQAAGGAKGALFHRLVFSSAPGVQLTRVLSEGESRTLSLAAFFTELSTTPVRSAVIFDDPVSSLDHVWRERIAHRLGEEATSRQVIIFTHDLLFLTLLIREADKAGAQIHHQYLRGNGQSGFVSEELDWLAMRTNERIGHLKNSWQAAEKLSRTGNAQTYEREAREIYALLREAWEKAISEVLLNEVVERYRHSIETQKVRYLHDITQEDCSAVEDGMSECSRWMRGHDAPAADGTPFPKPQDVLKRIIDLEEWAKRIRKRRS